MLKILIGDQAFKAGMDLYFARHDGEAATIEQFVACFAEASGQDLGPFSRWYDQAGTPRVTVERRQDAAGGLRLLVRQETPPTPGQPEKRPQVIPIACGFVNPDGSATPSRIIVLEGAEAEFAFPDAAPGATPSLLRGFSAPVNLEVELSDEELLTLARLDSDPFNRWQSLQSLAMKLLRRSAAAVRGGLPALTHDGWPRPGPPSCRMASRTRLSPRWRSRCRASRTSPARPAPTSIPRRSTSPAARCARRSAARSSRWRRRRGLRSPMTALILPTPLRPSAGRSATPRSTSWRWAARRRAAPPPSGSSRPRTT